MEIICQEHLRLTLGPNPVPKWWEQPLVRQEQQLKMISSLGLVYLTQHSSESPCQWLTGYGPSPFLPI